ncbi:hypothetical protein [Nocardia sp. NPDC019302]|uniref:hypothetical protein n=1 Tax=Nocardia sp. NPDC019302 TaxID=3154592 RepID=UPI0033D2A496
MSVLSAGWDPVTILISTASSAISLLIGFLIWMMRRIVRGDLIPAATVEAIVRDLRALQQATERNAIARERGEAELRSQNSKLLEQGRVWDAILHTAEINHSGSGHAAQTTQD